MRIFIIFAVLLSLLGCSPSAERYEDLVAKAQKYESAGQLAEAKIEARNAIKLNPNGAPAYVVLGRCSIKEQDVRAAYGAFGQALQFDPQNKEALTYMARIMLNSGDAEEAKKYINELLRLEPNSIEAQNMMAGVLIGQNKLSDAQSIFERILAQSPGNEDAVSGLAAVYSLRKEPQKAKQILKDALAKAPGSTRITVLLLNQAMQNGEFAEAQEYIRGLLAVDPENQKVVLQQADIYFRAGNAAKGQEVLEEFLAKKPDAESIRMRLAELYSNAGGAQKGIAVLDAAPRSTPDLQLLKSLILLRSGDVENALSGLKAVASNMTSSQAASRAGLVIADVYIARNDAGAAISELGALLEKNPGNIEALSKRGQLYIAQRKFNEAIADLRIVARELPNDHVTAISLANAQNAVGNTRLAEDGLKELIKKAPDNALAYLTLANLYLQQQRSDEAVQTLSFGRNLVGDIADLHFSLADILAAQGRYSQAESILKELEPKEKFTLAVRMKLAGLYAKAGEFDKSIALYDRIIAAMPDFLDAVEARILTQLAAGKNKEALAYAEKRQKERPADPTAAALVGETALAASDLKKSESAFLKAMALAPQWDQPVLRLAQIYASTNRLDDGIKSCLAVMDKQSDALAPILLLALLQERKGDNAAAEVSYRNILSKQPTMLVACNNLANLLSLHGPTPARLEEAESYAAIAARSEAPEAHSTLGWIYHLQGRPAVAEVELRKALAKAPADNTIRYRLAVVLVAMNKKDEARPLLEEVIATEQDASVKSMAQKLQQSI